jgi:N-methylhydantoinase A/oxoprolinase/acetone carboxylase beta subunit
MTAGTRIGVDTGGTFTDLILLRDGRLEVHKCRSTPEDPARSILQGVRHLIRAEPQQQVAALEVVHGSTVATNAVLERKGARVALVTTQGVEDVLTIGRQTRRELYNFFVTAPRPLVERHLIFGLPERLDAQGKIIQSLDRAALKRLVKSLKRSLSPPGARTRPEEQKVDIVAVCFLHAYANPIHERQVAEQLRRAGLRVCASHEVLPEYREFERWSTTALNAYVTPLMDEYLGNLEQQLGRSNVRIMQSNGGSISAAAARAQAVRTVLSGPAAGVVGARTVAEAAGFSRIISFDMGGTSTDVSLVADAIATTTESVIGDFPMRLPIIDIHTVGAGGGSIATQDSGGALRVGPQSAGADPGPACYGSGSALTVTDANLLLGRLDPDYFLGGRMALQPERARELAAKMAAKFGIPMLQLAEGILRVVNANMERALRVVSVRRGHDPRDFALVAFGGAGGMHGAELAARLDIGTVLVPRHAGVLSALGMLLADVTQDYSASVLQPSDSIAPHQAQALFQPLLRQARKWLAAEGYTRHHVIEQLTDVRYIGQSYEITIPFSTRYRQTFNLYHQRLYGYANPDRPTEIVNVRVRACGITAKPKLPRRRARLHQCKPDSVKAAWFSGRQVRTAFYHWDSLIPGGHGSGPAVITGSEATVVVPSGFNFQIDPFSNVIIQQL